MKNLWVLLVFSSVLSAAVAQNPKVVNGETKGCKLKIGDEYAGGIVFYLYPGADCHGLVCAPNDQAKNIEWSQANALCKSLTLNNYSDWRLPTKYELNQMYLNLHQAGLCCFGSNSYWSSTEGSNNDAWNQYFNNGYQTFDTKNYSNNVRAVRSF